MADLSRLKRFINLSTMSDKQISDLLDIIKDIQKESITECMTKAKHIITYNMNTEDIDKKRGIINDAK